MALSPSDRPRGLTAAELTVIPLEERGPIPNNPRLPVLVYHAAFPTSGDDIAGLIESRFEENGWPPQWRDGIYDFHHYHVRGHEVLGIARGEVELVLGGEGGRRLTLKAGDALLLPAGTGHRRLSASDDLLVVGAYPPGQSADIQRDAATTQLKQAIARLSFPATDPVSGPDGPLSRHWSDNLNAAPAGGG